MLPENISLTNDLSKGLSSFLEDRKYSKIAVLVDENTLSSCWPLLKDHLPSSHLIEIKSGESNKTIETCGMVWASMTKAGLDRKALLINLGGGVIGDMGGFCAATYKRGIDFIQIPTTLLSQSDASVGGKLGIDFMGYKNHIGLFKAPEHIFIDPTFLKTLPLRELKSGYAEVIKHALIADNNYWEILIAKDLNHQEWEKHIRHSVKVKSKIVEKDPKEAGLRKILNFGHTVGHGIESYFLEKAGKRLLHGEAIAAGMVCEAYLSFKKSNLNEQDLKAVTAYLIATYGVVAIEVAAMEEISQLVTQDKKNEKNTIKCSLLHHLGKAVYDIAVTPDEIIASLEYYQKQKG